LEVIVSNDIRVIDYNTELLQWCNKNLVLSNPEYFKAERSGRYLGNIQKNFFLYERRGDTLVIPFGVVKDVWPLVSKYDFKLSSSFAPSVPLKMSGGIELYPYQENAVRRLLRAKNGLLEAPCGSGKTQMGLALIKELGLKTLWLTHTKDLLKQSMDRAKQYFKGDFGTITGGKINVGNDITFATVQTMAKLNVQDFANDFSVVIVDECHKAAGSPTRIMQFYKVITALKARHKYGLSATMHRADGLIASTKAILGPVVVSISDGEIGEKIIKSNYVEIPTVLPDSEYYLNFDGTLDHNKLIEYIVYHEGRNHQIKKIIQENPERNILVLSHRVHHLQILQDIIQRPSYLVVGSVDKNRRAEILEKIKSTTHGNIMLSTYSLAKEGLDIPNLDMLILATPHKDKAIVLQSVGRIERNFVGKPKPIVCDLVDNYIFYCKKIAKTRKNLIINR